MKYLHYEFNASAGDVNEVSIDRAANVQLLDPENYENYKNGRGFRYTGGYATTTPVRFEVPRTSPWHVIVDLGGGAGHVRASAQLLAESSI